MTLGKLTLMGILFSLSLQGAKVVQAGGGSFASYALLEDGTLLGWGGGNETLALGEQKSGLLPFEMYKPDCESDSCHDKKIIQYDAYSYHVCAVFGSGRVKCWGENRYGKLGLGVPDKAVGDKPGQSVPELPFLELGKGFHATMVKVGALHSCALSKAGKIKCWGSGAYGMLGLTTGADFGQSPDHMGDNLPYVDLGAKATQICSGYVHSCALTDSGHVKCWGHYKAMGQELGNHHIGLSNTPVGKIDPIDFGTSSKVTKVECGYYTSCVLFEDGQVKCWGRSASGQLGNGLTEDVIGDDPGEMGAALPYTPIGKTKAIDIQCHNYHCCTIMENRSLKCWGTNTNAQLGIENNIPKIGLSKHQMGKSLKYTNLGKFAQVKNVGLGYGHTCAVLMDDTIKCWGLNHGNNVGILGWGLGGPTHVGKLPGQMGEKLNAVILP